MKKNLLLLFLIIPFLMNAQLTMDDFESYSAGSFDTQWDASQWVGWFGGPSGVEISNTTVASGTNSMEVGQNDDIVALLPVLNSGIQEVSFNQFLPSINGSYFNLQHNYTNSAGDWAIEVFFSDTAGGSVGRIVTDGGEFDFDVVYDTWVPILFVLNFSAEEGQFFYNGNLVHTWVLSTNAAGGPGLNAINGINFFGACLDDVGPCTSLAFYDDIAVQEGTLPDFSVALESAPMGTEYASIPLSQVSPFNLSATVSNNGAMDVSNVSIVATITNASGAEVYSESLGSVASLASGASATLDSPSSTFTPSEVSTYTVTYISTIDGLDDVLDGNTDNAAINITESVYARADENYFNGFGSTNDPGIYGHSYEVINNAEVLGIDVTHAGDGVGETVRGRIMSLSNTGNPMEIIAVTDVLTISEAGALGEEVTLSVVFPNPVVLAPGNYAFMIEQQGPTSLSVSISNNIFTPNTSFLSIDDGATWDAIEDIPVATPILASLAINPVFGDMIVAVEDVDFAPSIELTPNVTTGRTLLSVELESTQDLLVEVYNMNGQQVYGQNLKNVNGIVQHELDLSNQVSGMYFVTISSDGKRTSKKLSLIK